MNMMVWSDRLAVSRLPRFMWDGYILLWLGQWFGSMGVVLVRRQTLIHSCYLLGNDCGQRGDSNEIRTPILWLS